MEITSPPKISPQQAITLSEAQIKLESLKVGQQLLARVLAVQSNGNVSLQLNNAILNAQTNLPLTQGQTLSLLIAQLGKQIVLKPSAQSSKQLILNQAMREVLPQQKPLNELFTALKKQLKPDRNAARIIPTPISQMIKQVIQSLPAAKDISNAQGLKKAMLSSGPLLEKNIVKSAQTQTNLALNTDLKAMLSKLKTVLINQVRSGHAQNSQQAQKANANAATAALMQTPRAQLNKRQTTRPIQPSTISNTVQPANKTANNESINIQKTINAEKSAQIKPSTSAQANAIKFTAIPASEKLIQRSIAQTATPAFKLSGATLAGDAKNPASTNFLRIPSKESQAEFIKMVRILQKTNPEPTKPLNVNSQTQPSSTADLINNLLKTVESALARTQLHQLNTLADLESGKLAWTLELPIRHKEEIDIIKMRIQRDANNSNTAQSQPISVTISVDLENTGPIVAKITLLNSELSIGFWAERNQIFNLIENNAENLATRLLDSGINTCDINCHQGIISADLATDPPPSDGLLDIEA